MDYSMDEAVFCNILTQDINHKLTTIIEDDVLPSDNQAF